MSNISHELNKLKFYIDNDQLQNALDVLLKIDNENMDISSITDKEITILEKSLNPKKAMFNKIQQVFQSDTLTPDEEKYLQSKIKKSKLYNGTMIYEFLTNPKLFNSVQNNLNNFDKL